MTYAANALVPDIESNMFVKIKPSILLTTSNGFSWTVHSGNIWKTDFNLGYVWAAYFADEEQDLESDAASVGSGEYFYDAVENVLYVYSLSDPGALNFVATYEVYWSTMPAVFPRTPTTSVDPQGNPLVDWAGNIIRSPVVNEGQIDAIFGFIPVHGGSLSVEMVSGELNGLFVKSVFHKAQVEIYHLLGDLELINFKNIFFGLAERIQVTEDQATISINANQYSLERTYQEARYFSTTDYPNLEPGAVNEQWPIRKVYGRVIGFIPVNVDYSDTPSTTNNRDWIVSQVAANSPLETGDNASYVIDIDEGAANTTTETFYTGSNYIDVGDWVYLTDVAKTVEVITKTINKITHAAVGARAPTASDKIHRPYIRKITIIDEENKPWNLEYTTHWTILNGVTDEKGFTLLDNFEALIAGFPSPFNPSKHKIYVDVYGEKTLPQYRLSVGDIGSLPSSGGMVSNPVSVLADLIFPIRDFLPTQIDEGSFAQAITDIDSSFTAPVRVGLAIPKAHSDPFPTYNEIISDICKTALLRIHSGVYNGVCGLAISHFQSVQAQSADYELDSTEIYNVSIDIDGSDVYTDFQINFNTMTELYESVSNVFQYFKRIGTANEQIYSMYKTTRELIQDTLFIDSTNAEAYLTKIKSILSQHKVRYTFNTQYKLWDARIGEVISITREQILGIDYVEGQTDTIKGSVVEISKSTGGITATIEVY